jgi:predicted nucleotide-binding protein (sugar kinase/HSP70/actin superfamily)
MKMTTQIAENIIQEVQTDLETISDFCHYNKMGEEITFMENATVIFKKHVDLTEEEEMVIRVAMSIGYSAGRQKEHERQQHFIRLHWGSPAR